jgi:hypothetical protein
MFESCVDDFELALNLEKEGRVAAVTREEEQ